MTQVVVVGAGNAALAAAVSARENGADVIVAEKAPRHMRGGNTYWSGGGFRFVIDDPAEIRPLLPNTNFVPAPYSSDEFYADLIKTSGGRADPMLCRLLADNSKETILWMHRVGLKFEPPAHLSREFGGLAGDNVRISAPGIAARSIGEGAGLSDMWFAAAERAGVDIRYETGATELEVGDAGNITGIMVRDASGYHRVGADAVVLGCGGFEANVEMRTRYIGALMGQATVRGTPYNQGDGHRMSLSVGAMPAGQWSGCHSSPISADWREYTPREIGDRSGRQSYMWGVMLNRSGVRFLDEGAASFSLTYAKYGLAILAQPGNMAYQIFDSNVLGLLDPPAEPRYALSRPAVADTLEELVSQLDFDDPKQALATLRSYNASPRTGSSFDPTREDGLSTMGLSPEKTNWASRLEKPPFHGYRVTGGITFSFGGLKINERAEVIGTDWRPIGGLYACGEMVGGLFYDNYAAACGLIWGATSGRIAGRSAAQQPYRSRH